jgi:hypothetical protein
MREVLLLFVAFPNHNARFGNANKRSTFTAFLKAHLAEAAWWVLNKQEVYREPRLATRSFVDARVSAINSLALEAE